MADATSCAAVAALDSKIACEAVGTAAFPAIPACEYSPKISDRSGCCEWRPVARTNPNEDGTCLFYEKGSKQMDDDAAKTARGGADATCGGEAGYPLWDEQSCDEVAGTCAQTAAVACGDATTAGCQSDDGGGFEDACVALTGSAACLANSCSVNDNKESSSRSSRGNKIKRKKDMCLERQREERLMDRAKRRSIASSTKKRCSQLAWRRRLH